MCIHKVVLDVFELLSSYTLCSGTLNYLRCMVYHLELLYCGQDCEVESRLGVEHILCKVGFVLVCCHRRVWCFQHFPYGFSVELLTCSGACDVSCTVGFTLDVVPVIWIRMLGGWHDQRVITLLCPTRDEQGTNEIVLWIAHYVYLFQWRVHVVGKSVKETTKKWRARILHVRWRANGIIV